MPHIVWINQIHRNIDFFFTLLWGSANIRVKISHSLFSSTRLKHKQRGRGGREREHKHFKVKNSIFGKYRNANSFLYDPTTKRTVPLTHQIPLRRGIFVIYHCASKYHKLYCSDINSCTSLPQKTALFRE